MKSNQQVILKQVIIMKYTQYIQRSNIYILNVMFLSPTFNNYQLMTHCISTKLPLFPLPQFTLKKFHMRCPFHP